MAFLIPSAFYQTVAEFTLMQPTGVVDTQAGLELERTY